MGAVEKATKGTPTRDLAEASLVIRLFGIFAFLFGLPYLIQGVNLLMGLGPIRRDFLTVQLILAFISLNFLIGTTSILIGPGLFFGKEWARKAWLGFLILTLILHFHVIVLQFLFGQPPGLALYKWIGGVILFSIMSWAYLSRASTKARFH